MTEGSERCPPRKPDRSWNVIVLEALEALGGESVELGWLYQYVCDEDPEAGSWDISNGGAEAEIRSALQRLQEAGRVERTRPGVWSFHKTVLNST